MDTKKEETSTKQTLKGLNNEKSVTLKQYKNANEVFLEHKEKNTRYIIYRNEVYSSGDYLDSLGHPGGEAVIKEYFGRDVTVKMHELKHSKSAYRTLKNYLVGEILEKVEYSIDSVTGDNSLLKAHTLISEEMSERLAKRFDLTKPIYPQLIDKTLTHEEYMAFIREPKILSDPTKQIRIFNEDFFEFFSSTPWYAVPLAWLPTIVLILTLHWKYLDDYSVYRAIGLFILGFFEWSFTEYVLHRFLFHCEEKLPTNGIVFGLHFIIHGIHHAFPQDPGRLVFPIFNAVCVGLLKFLVYLIFFRFDDAVFVMAGFGLGYVCYDMFHYYCHHAGADMFQFMKIYHQKHHHKDPDRGFGVTTPIWDWVFGTALK